MKYAILATALAIAGCASTTGTGQLFREGKTYPLEFNTRKNTFATMIDGERYAGSFVVNTSYGSGVVVKGSKVTTVGTTSLGTQGRALLLSEAGKPLRCEFMTNGLDVQGTCLDSSGAAYDMVINR